MTAKRMPGNWFNVNNGAYCGIVMPEHVMKKLAKLYAKHNCICGQALDWSKERDE